MQYAMSIHAKPGYTDALSEDEQKAMFADYVALGEDPRARGGAQLKPWAAGPALFATGVLRQSAGPFQFAVELASRESRGIAKRMSTSQLMLGCPS
jgi:hypothetical protein